MENHIEMQDKIGPDLSDSLDLKIFDSFLDSSRRVRYSFLLIIVTTVLSFAGYWNSRQTSWQKSRIDLCSQQLVELLDPQDYNLYTFPQSERKVLRSAERDSTYLYEIKIKELTLRKERLTKLYLERCLYFSIPILGIYFDINDLGILSGTAFAVLLFFLFFSYDREFQNLRIIQRFFQNNKENALLLKKVYFYISSSQILNTPNLRGLINEFPSSTKLMRLMHYLPKIIIFFPTIIFLFIFLHDISTFSIGEIICVSNALYSVVISGILYVFILIFTGFIFGTSISMEKLWKRLYKAVRQEKRNKTENNNKDK